MPLRSLGVSGRAESGDRSFAPVLAAFAALGILGACSSAITPSETPNASTDASADAPAVVGPDASTARPDAAPPVDASIDAGAVDASVDETKDSGFVEAQHKAQPTVPYNGGSLLSTIQIVTITWAGDASATALNAFDAWMPASTFYTSVVAQYNVHAGSQVATWSVPTPPPATFDTSQVAAFLQAAVTAGSIPAPTPNTLYNFYPPPSMIVTQTYGTSVYTGCTDFQGFHDSVSVNGQTVAYAMAMRCPAWEQGLSDVDFATWGSSHEIGEAATDPFSGTGWAISDPTLDALYSGGEIGDLCDGHPTRVDSHYVTELWSNAAASADQRPCVPAPPGPMYGATPSSDSLSVGAGSSVSTTVTVYSSGPLTPAPQLIASPSSGVTMTGVPTSASNGDTFDVTFGVTADAGAGSSVSYILLYTSDGYNTPVPILLNVQ